MSRQEERKQAAQQRYSGESQYQVAKAQAFLTGARWADKTMLDKACEWLNKSLYYSQYKEGCFNTESFEEFVDEFRKAMEE